VTPQAHSARSGHTGVPDGAYSTPTPGNALDRCVNGRTCHGDHDGWGAWCAPPLCADCLDAGARDLRALVLDYADLEQLLVAGGTQDLYVSGTRDPPTPYALGIDALQHEIWHVTTSWEEIIREVCALAEPAIKVRPGWAVQHAVAILETRVKIIVGVGPCTVHIDGEPTEQTGLQAVQGFTWLHRRARSALGLTRHVERLYGDCAVCGWHDLRREHGSETVYCQHCKAGQTWDDYRRWLALSHEVAKRSRRG
jgi:hypothetical protein